MKEIHPSVKRRKVSQSSLEDEENGISSLSHRECSFTSEKENADLTGFITSNEK
jgi:hypothetical protein